MFRRKTSSFSSYGGTRRKSRARTIGKILLVVLIVLVIAAGAAAWYVLTPYGPTAQAEQAITTPEQGITVQNTDQWIAFTPAKTSKVGVILYQGARVKPEAYSLLANDLAKAGHPVYIMKMPLNFAFFKPDAAQAVLDSHPQQKFVIGGHSLGGVFAAHYAADHKDRIAGVFFLASYPDSDADLGNSGLPVLSITASNDGVLQRDKYEAARTLLPATTVYYSIKGGDHAQFGSYGQQKGDKPAQITEQEQRSQTVNALISWMKDIPATASKSK
ncbi:alpha/beta fold hydrolase [Paenibacillus campi]|uniref:alpha/beta fold hydrolase n=1 Tax=Paenibacillus campi TaxID=3106031 RepID=UPI002AFE8F5E|nr:alpha/beta fold hydrolase [Paenibacillus sp. SGZ-1014]